MGTKRNPGRFDCYHAAEPNEELFVLLARDRLAPFLTAIWAKVRAGQPDAAAAMFYKMLGEVAPRYVMKPDKPQAGEAIDVALAMVAWRKENRTP